MWSIGIDGTYESDLNFGQVAGYVATQPRTFMDNFVAYSSNWDHPGTNSFEMHFNGDIGGSSVRITNNALYDGFSIFWMNSNQLSVGVGNQAQSSLQSRMERQRRLQ